MPAHSSPAELAAMLRDLYVGRRTGRLVFEGGTTRAALFWKGRVVSASSGETSERLGELLVERGRLTADDLRAATEKVVSEGRRLGEVLLALGVLDRDGLEDAIAEHVREVFVRALSTAALTYHFETMDPEKPLEEDVSSRIATGDLILAAVDRVPNEALDVALGEMDRRVVLSNDPLLRFQRISLGPEDGYVLSRVDGTTSAREMLSMIPMVPEDAKRCLYRLLSAGVVEFDAATPAPARATSPPVSTPPKAGPEAQPSRPVAAAEAPPEPRLPPAERPSPPPARPAAAAPPPVPPAAGPPGADPGTPVPLKGISGQRQVISAAFEALAGKNHFEVLDLTRQAREDDVKKAYFKLAREFHPDRLSDARLADLRPKAEAIFMKLGAAYEILRDPERRGAYEADLASRAPRAPRTETSEPERPPREPGRPDTEFIAYQVDEALKKAQDLLKQEKYWDVIQHVEPQLDLAQGIVKVKAHFLLARCYLQNPNWLRRAEEQLQAVIDLDPRHVEALFILGRLYADKGLKSRAHALLQRAVALKPDHEKANALLARVQPTEPEEAKPQGGGLLKKLFGKS